MTNEQKRIIERAKRGIWPVFRPDKTPHWAWRRGRWLDPEDPPNGHAVRALVDKGVLEKHEGTEEHLFMIP